MAWIEPRTDWTASSFFNVEDYNRIAGNLAVMKEVADKLYGTISLRTIPSVKNIGDDIYASEITDIEYNVYLLNDATYRLTRYQIGVKKTYSGNSKTQNYEDMNRIEDAMKQIYALLMAQYEALPRLAFTLGGQKGIRV